VSGPWRAIVAAMCLRSARNENRPTIEPAAAYQNPKKDMQSSALRKLRIAVAAVLFSGLVFAFAGVHWAAAESAGRWLASTQFVASLVALATGASFSIAFVLIVVATLLVGRIYCSAICPLGILQDILARSVAFARRKKAPLPYAAPQNWIRHVFLGGAVAAIALGWGTVAIALLDPYGNFGRIVSILFRPLVGAADRAVVGAARIAGLSLSAHLVRPWAGIGIVAFPAAVFSLVVILVALRGRLYCNTVCPVGTLLGLFSRWAAFRVTIERSACQKCGECLRACKAQCIDLRKGAIDYSRCVACYDCLGVCGHHSIGYRFAWKRSARASAPQTSPSVALEKDSRADAISDPGRRRFIGGAVVAVAAVFGAKKLRAADDPGGQKRLGERKDRLVRPTSPPGSAGVERFLERCVACQLCVSACPSNVLQPSFAEYGFRGLSKPRLDFSKGSCDFNCRRCGEVCPTGAIELLALADKQTTRIGVAHFEPDKCMVRASGKACTICSEKCPTKALRTVPCAGGLQLPAIQTLLCIGCGTCENVCPAKPAKAFTVIGRRVHNRVKRPVVGQAGPNVAVSAESISSAVCSTTPSREPEAVSAN
jgi:polyferredoxin